MSRWPTVHLIEVAKLDRDGVDPSSIKDGTLYVGLEHIESGGRLLDVKAVSSGDLASTKFRFDKRHLLYGKLRPYLAKIALPDFDGICSTDILPVLPGPKLDRSYLTYFLRQTRMVSYATSLSEGINLPRLSPKALERFEIPLPPLAEQKRIAAILDQADDLRRKRRTELALLQDLPPAIFDESFSDSGSGNAAFPTALLDNIAELINGDRSSNYPSGDDLVDEGVLFLNTKNIDGSKIDLSACNFITPQKFASLSRGKLKRHDLVITLRGTLGQCAEFDCSYETGFINAQMMIIRSSDRVLPTYLRAFLSHRRTQASLQKDSSGSAVPQLTSRQIGELVIPVPPRTMQAEFAQKLSHVSKLYANAAQHLSKLDALFLSLQHRAFEGAL